MQRLLFRISQETVATVYNWDGQIYNYVAWKLSIGFWIPKTIEICSRLTGLFIETVSIYQVSPSVAPSGGTDRELNADSRLRTFLYPTISNSFMCSSALMLKSRSHTVVQKRDEQIKNKKHRTFHPSGIRRSPSHAKLGMVIEDVHTIFAPQTFWEGSYSLSLRARKIRVNAPRRQTP